jgi:hypothetical protein
MCVHDHLARVRNRSRNRQRGAEALMQSEVRVLYQILDTLVIAAQQVGEAGQRDRIIGREPGEGGRAAQRVLLDAGHRLHMSLNATTAPICCVLRSPACARRAGSLLMCRRRVPYR